MSPLIGKKLALTGVILQLAPAIGISGTVLNMIASFQLFASSGQDDMKALSQVISAFSRIY